MSASSLLPSSGLARRLALLGAFSALSGCGGGEAVCTPPNEPYLSARSNSPLRIPQGTTTPSRAEALAIPDVRATANGSGRASCLDEPPSYFRSAGTVARSPEEVVASWAQAWANREADAVIALYSASFKAPTDSAGSGPWLEQRREQVATGPTPDPMIEGLTIETGGGDRRVAKFVQKFGANALRKELTLVREGGSWRIVEEQVAALK
jgi:hypothetical protein